MNHAVVEEVVELRNGKKVTVSIELQARFDEQNNIRISERLREVAIASGMRSMRQDGLDKVAAGVTSISEILRVAV